ncbi:MAG: YiiD C-terminal domain-containing protein [Motiliproteus sp.]
MSDSQQARVEAFRQKIFDQIPLTRAMGFDKINYDGRDLAFELSLEPNHNDKGTAFAGALSAAANLCGWGAITLLLEAITEQSGIAYDVVIRDSRLEYMLPVTTDFVVQARLPDIATVDAFQARLQERGKARIDLLVEVVENGRSCFQFSGSYVALEKKQWV